jgi:hypothetical protein
LALHRGLALRGPAYPSPSPLGSHVKVGLAAWEAGMVGLEAAYGAEAGHSESEEGNDDSA